MVSTAPQMQPDGAAIICVAAAMAVHGEAGFGIFTSSIYEHWLQAEARSCRIDVETSIQSGFLLGDRLDPYLSSQSRR